MVQKFNTGSLGIIAFTVIWFFLGYIPHSWSKGIDWDGVLLSPNPSQPGQSRNRNRSNLPGVRTGEVQGKANEKACDGGLNGGTFGGSSFSGRNCGNGVPLIRFRDGQFDGTLIEFPR